ncbi:MAG TPA: hypothetical protein DCO75_13385 [Fibrobacteres bacterium]|nr:hypothetical protein [Fibrobacterota bacterium]
MPSSKKLLRPCFKAIFFVAILAAVTLPVYAKKPASSDSLSKLLPKLEKNTTGRKDPAVLKAIYDKLYEIETRPADITRLICDSSGRTSESRDSAICLSARVPKGRPLEWIIWNITQATNGTTYSVSDCSFDEHKQLCYMTFTSSEKTDPQININISRSNKYLNGSAKLAIVGEIREDTSYQIIVEFLSIKENLSIMIVPGKKQSTLIAQLAEQYHKEIIIALPMEPDSKIFSGFSSPVIMVHYSKDMIRSIILQAEKNIPLFSGFSNLWGERAITDSRIMNIVLNEIKKSHGYFLEMKTAKNSLAPELTGSMGISYEEFSGSITDNLKPADIAKQLKAYSAIAQTNGIAIVAVPLNKPLIQAIKTTLPWFRQNGINLVFPSQTFKIDKK